MQTRFLRFLVAPILAIGMSGCFSSTTKNSQIKEVKLARDPSLAGTKKTISTDPVHWPQGRERDLETVRAGDFGDRVKLLANVKFFARIDTKKPLNDLSISRVLTLSMEAADGRALYSKSTTTIMGRIDFSMVGNTQQFIISEDDRKLFNEPLTRTDPGLLRGELLLSEWTLSGRPGEVGFVVQTKASEGKSPQTPHHLFHADGSNNGHFAPNPYVKELSFTELTTEGVRSALAVLESKKWTFDFL